MREIAEAFETPDKETIGRRIAASRLAMGMSRETFAEKIGVSVQFAADVEYGKKGMSIVTFYATCQALEITPNYLLAGNRYSFAGSEEYARVCEEAAVLLKDCSDEQIAGAGQILRIYVEGIKGKQKQER